MTMNVQFVDFPKSQDVRDIVESRFETCLDHLHLAKEIHLNLIFKHVHFNTTELSINITGDKIHENVHVTGRDIPHTIDEGVKKLKNILHKTSDKLKDTKHAARERRGRKKNQNSETA